MATSLDAPSVPSPSPSPTSIPTIETPSSPLPPSLPSDTKSIRDSSGSLSNASFEDGDTFYELLSIFLDQPVGSLSISPANRDVALGARKGLFIVDLQNPYDPPRFLPHNSAWEVADVQWNPWPARSMWVASTSNQKAVIYNLSIKTSSSISPSSLAAPLSPIEHTLHAHTRAVTDINWSAHSSEILATCALDGWVWSWDLRAGGRRPVWGVSSWGTAATQVKWNRREQHVIASAHDNKVMIWDDRMGALPVTTINGHSSKIYGIDWSRTSSTSLITCSLDKSFKAWSLPSISSPTSSSSSLPSLSSPSLTVPTSSPVWRARYLPFGNGVLTLPQRSDHALSIWGFRSIEEGRTEPVAKFLGAREGVKEFVWRTRGGEDDSGDDRKFQLVTWAKDRRLRLWPISEEIVKEVGHVPGAPIRIPVTRRGCPDISYRTFAESAAPPLPLAFPPRNFLSPTSSSVTSNTTGPSFLTSSLLTAGFANLKQSPTSSQGGGPFISLGMGMDNLGREKENTHESGLLMGKNEGKGKAMMTVGKVRNRKQKASDRLAWMEGVKIIKPSGGGDDGRGEGGMMIGASTTQTQTRIPETDSGRESRAGETRSSSLVRGTDGGTAREGGDTERAESVVSPGSKATRTEVGKDGTGFANLGEEITAAVRRLPRVNFEKVHIAGRTCTVSLYSPLFLRATFTFPKNYPSSSAPAIEIEKNAEVPLKSRAFLLQSIRKLMAVKAGRRQPSFEMALRFLLGDRSLDDGGKDENEEDDEEEAEEGLEGVGLSADLLRNNLNVPPPRRGGAVFGPLGNLVVFFPTNAFVAPVEEKEEVVPTTPAAAKSALPPRLSEAFGAIGSGDTHSGWDYQETDEALQMATGASFRTHFDFKPTPATTPPNVTPMFSTIVHIKNVSHLTIIKPGRPGCGPLLHLPPLDFARMAAVDAKAQGDVFLWKVWTTMETFLEGSGMVAGQLETTWVDHLLPDLLSYLFHLKDIQTLGIIACVLENFRRSSYEDTKLKVATVEPDIDYFSSRAVPEASQESSPSGYDVYTPLASGRQRTSVDYSHSPKASWTNLTGLFNSSVLSLKTGATPPTPGTPPRTSRMSPRLPAVGSRGSSKSPAADRRGSLDARGFIPRMSPAIPVHSSRLARTRSSPGVTFGSTSSITPINSKSGSGAPSPGVMPRKVVIQIVDQSSFLSKPVSWWLTEPAQKQFELVRLAYAELLYRWGRDHERLQVLKLCRSGRPPLSENFGSRLIAIANGIDRSVAVEITRACKGCRAALHPPFLSCSSCKLAQRRLMCTFCHLPVEALSQNCTICSHVGHADCLQAWFISEAACPTGCGCLCLSSGGLSGAFIAAARKPKASTGPERKAWGALRSPLQFFSQVV